jgi:gamma-glutamyl:cysteine ligase YbdK (ATP-grasp superfamily)
VHDGHRIAESLWLAAHVGPRRELLDLDTGVRRPLADRVAKLLEMLEPASRELGSEPQLARIARLATACGADRQRRLAAETGIEALPVRLAAETAATARRVRARAGATDWAGTVENGGRRARPVATSA